MASTPGVHVAVPSPTTPPELLSPRGDDTPPALLQQQRELQQHLQQERQLWELQESLRAAEARAVTAVSNAQVALAAAARAAKALGDFHRAMAEARKDKCGLINFDAYPARVYPSPLDVRRRRRPVQNAHSVPSHSNCGAYPAWVCPSSLDTRHPAEARVPNHRMRSRSRDGRSR